jgi:hypothetical protein
MCKVRSSARLDLSVAAVVSRRGAVVTATKETAFSAAAEAAVAGRAAVERLCLKFRAERSRGGVAWSRRRSTGGPVA